MYNTRGKETDTGYGVSKYLGIGRHLLKINDIELKPASTGSLKAIFHMEGRPVEETGFEGEGGALGKVGRIHTIYMKTEDQQIEFVKVLATIAEKMGVREKLDNATENVTNLEQLVAAAKPVLVGAGWAWYRIVGEEYQKQDSDDIGVVLHFSRFGYVASETEGESHLKEVDKDNKYDLKKVERIGSTTTAAVGTDEDDIF